MVLVVHFFEQQVILLTIRSDITEKEKKMKYEIEGHIWDSEHWELFVVSVGRDEIIWKGIIHYSEVEDVIEKLKEEYNVGAQ